MICPARGVVVVFMPIPMGWERGSSRVASAPWSRSPLHSSSGKGASGGYLRKGLSKNLSVLRNGSQITFQSECKTVVKAPSNSVLKVVCIFVTLETKTNFSDVGKTHRTLARGSLSRSAAPSAYSTKLVAAGQEEARTPTARGQGRTLRLQRRREQIGGQIRDILESPISNASANSPG